ncbi:trafficking protein particle complex 2 [Hygrophoropsis aurantiaca]|uniref:Trafficking protein particle complex 2 n=1 Tax=Hygrophoropsis aurantiaca TaxID=72124 RepID=A0ACB8AP22_9AGAM|nr:trafficking protein particle complex 2 [Hygrophoropsis aurantiaca]
MPPPLRLNAVAFISPQNHPILIRTFQKGDELKYHYIAHTSLDVIEERTAGNTAGGDAKSNPSSNECYLGLLYAMDDVAAYGYITPLKVKIVIALALTDSVVRDAELISAFKALHMALYHAVSNPFLKLDAATTSNEQYPYLLAGGPKWKNFRRRVDEISRALGGAGAAPIS